MRTLILLCVVAFAVLLSPGVASAEGGSAGCQNPTECSSDSACCEGFVCTGCDPRFCYGDCVRRPPHALSGAGLPGLLAELFDRAMDALRPRHRGALLTDMDPAVALGIGPAVAGCDLK